jgi:hypothetical protein
MQLKILETALPKPKPPKQIHIALKRENHNNCVRIVATDEDGNILNNIITLYDRGTYYRHVIKDPSCKNFFEIDIERKIVPNDMRYRN